MASIETPSGKVAGEENFPVGSRLIRAELRPHIHAFYQFARTADDIADNPSLAPAEKIGRLDQMAAALNGAATSASPAATQMHASLGATAMPPQHCLDLLQAFRTDATKLRYANWSELMTYCRYSATPVGRYVLDLHGECRDTWPASDALCAALQVINHLQDCGKDYRALDRVYLAGDAVAAANTDVAALAAPRASAALRSVIVGMARRTQRLLNKSAGLAAQVHDRRLAYEVALIQRLAEGLTARLITHDPLGERVHHRPLEVVGLAILAGKDQIAGRRRPSGQERARRPE